MLGLQPRPRPEVQAVANAERHVGTAKLDDAAVVVEHQIDLGKRRPEPVEPGHQPGAGEGRLDRDLQAVGRRLPAHLAQPPVDRVEAGGELTQQRAAGIGQPHTPMQALEQRRSEQRLELADLPADGCLRHQQLFGRAAEARCRPAASKLRSAVSGSRPRFIPITSSHRKSKICSFEAFGEPRSNRRVEARRRTVFGHFEIFQDVLRIVTFSPHGGQAIERRPGAEPPIRLRRPIAPAPAAAADRQRRGACRRLCRGASRADAGR